MRSVLSLGSGLAGGGALLLGAWLHRPLPPRLRHLAGAGPRSARPSAHGSSTALAVLAGRALRRPVSPDVARRWALAAAAAAICLAVVPPAAPVAVAAVLGLPVLRRRRQRRRHEAEVRRSLPEVVDLLVLAVGAGLTVPLAVAAVSERAAGPVAEALRRAVLQVGLGRRLVDALGEIPDDVGEASRPLVAALIASERYGAPLFDRLGRLADEVRAEARRRAEEAARRVPITLLFPLVFCTLPAFALLTVAPLLAGGLRSLRP